LSHEAQLLPGLVQDLHVLASTESEYGTGYTISEHSGVVIEYGANTSEIFLRNRFNSILIGYIHDKVLVRMGPVIPSFPVTGTEIYAQIKRLSNYMDDLQNTKLVGISIDHILP